MKKTNYLGWKNHATWNVSLWIQNDEALYALAKEIAASKYTRPYRGFAENLKDIGITETSDGVSYSDKSLGITELDNMIREL